MEVDILMWLDMLIKSQVNLMGSISMAQKGVKITPIV